MEKTIKAVKTAEQVFAYFSKLPPEIRAMVWYEFLENESKSRYIAAHSEVPHLLPEIHLVSPLLNVTAESRAVALNFYNTKLIVFDVYLKWDNTCGGIDDDTFSFFPKGHLYVNMLKDHFSSDWATRAATMNLHPADLHFMSRFTERDAPEVHPLGPLTEKVPDEYLPLVELPNWSYKKL
ncbi:hypothetical protein PG990_012903 [Apiospora arundinis]